MSSLELGQGNHATNALQVFQSSVFCYLVVVCLSKFYDIICLHTTYSISFNREQKKIGKIFSLVNLPVCFVFSLYDFDALG